MTNNTIKTETQKTNADAFFTAVADTLDQLAARWEDESEYEDINDYQKPLEPIAARHGVRILKMTKRPFGLHFTVDAKVYAAFVNRRGIGYKRIS